MIFLVYAKETDQSIAANLGLADYSYFFVMKRFIPVLEQLGKVVIVHDIETVDAQYEQWLTHDPEIILLSFTPPHKTPQGLRCPVFPVFAWEYSTIPDESWSNEPRNNWAAMLRSFRGAMTHSRFSVEAVHQALGASYPVVSLPAPLWDEYASLYERRRDHLSWQLEIANGVVLDSHALGLHQSEKTAPVSFESAACHVQFDGIVYTSIFNPNDHRKNCLDLLTGFCYAFRDQPDVTLLMKLAYHDAVHACGLVLHEMKKLVPYRCRVVAVQGYLEDEAYRQLVRHSTYVVNTARGEGQCLPLMELMSAGKPAIAPDHSAMADYINDKNAFVVRSSPEWTHWPHDPRLVLRAFRYRIDWQSLRDAYLESYRVACHEPERYMKMAEQAHQDLRQHCSKKIIADRLRDFLDGLGYAMDGCSRLYVRLKSMALRLRHHFSR